MRIRQVRQRQYLIELAQENKILLKENERLRTQLEEQEEITAQIVNKYEQDHKEHQEQLERLRKMEIEYQDLMRQARKTQHNYSSDMQFLLKQLNIIT